MAATENLSPSKISQGIDGGPTSLLSISISLSSFFFFLEDRLWRCNLSLFSKCCIWQWRFNFKWFTWASITSITSVAYGSDGFNLEVLPEPLSQVWQWRFNLSLYPKQVLHMAVTGLTLKFYLSLFLKFSSDVLSWASFPSIAYGSDGFNLKVSPEPLADVLQWRDLTWASFSSVAVTANLSLEALMGNLILSF